MMSSSSFSSPSLLLNLPNPKTTTTSSSSSSSSSIPISTQANPKRLTPTTSTPPLLHTADGRPRISRRNALLLGLLPALPFLPPPPPEAVAVEDRPDQCSLTVAPSGLAFCDRVVGAGAAAMKGQLIKAHYTGKLENGKVFDSSYKRGNPLTFRIGVGEVIKGWDQGILGGDGIPPMLAGGKRLLKLPPELGYGGRGAGCRGGECIIPPDSTLLFDVEFIG